MSEHPRLVQVRQHILKHNDSAARALRERFHGAGTYVVSLVSSPAPARLRFWRKCSGRSAAVTGSPRWSAIWQPTTTPANWLVAGRLSSRSSPARSAIWKPTWSRRPCSAGSGKASISCSSRMRATWCARHVRPRRGAASRFFLVTEGEDKPLKYPTIFNTSDVAVITKIDIASAVEFDRIAAHRSIQSVRPGMPIWEISAKTGEGMDAWLGFLESRLTDSRQVPPGGRHFEPNHAG